MKRIFAVLAVSALMAAMMVASAMPAFAHDGNHGDGDDCNSSNQQAGLLNNTNVLGSQQNQQGSCNEQTDDDTGGLIGDIL